MHKKLGKEVPKTKDEGTPSNMEEAKYTMRISRLTVDKLGVKLYDKVSAVIAELISNSYDADATSVTVQAPMGQYLATKADGKIEDKGFEIVVEDDGGGMTPEEMQSFYLIVGAERREDPKRGDTSPRYERKVMGRKGVGKLAPFGICKVIEVVSAGGDEITRKIDGHNKKGYLTSHVIMNYEDIKDEQGTPIKDYEPMIGTQDETLSDTTFTKVILRNFDKRRVPDIDTLSRQIAQRFGIEAPKWKIIIKDNTKTEDDPEHTKIVGAFDVKKMPNTLVKFEPAEDGVGRVIGPDDNVIEGFQPGIELEGKFYPLQGWVAYSKEPYKDELMAGVRIYCRGKIAAQTRDFNQKAGFTGEHNIRSYLVGELFANWLDEEEDLIQTDRRDILWSHDLGTAFQEWGQKVVKKIGTLSRDPMRKTTMEKFFEKGRVEDKVKEVYPAKHEEGMRQNAIELAKMFGKSIKPSEAEDESIVRDLVDLSISFAPHMTFDVMMRKASEKEDTPLNVLNALLRTARIAELASYGKIADQRLDVIDRLGTLKDEPLTPEDSLQQLIEEAPWLINPEWNPITSNQSLASVKVAFEKYFEEKTGEKITLADFSKPNKRPDFVLTAQEGMIQIIEIKKPKHSITNKEMERINNYHETMDNFFKEKANREVVKEFKGYHITLVCDGEKLTGVHKTSFIGLKDGKKLTHINWMSFLAKTEKVHQNFLTEAQRLKKIVDEKDED